MTLLAHVGAIRTLADLDRLTRDIEDRDVRIIIGHRLPDGKFETFPFVEVPDADEGYDPSSGPGLVLIGCEE
ncbi:hypothetical protein GCM10025867_48910 (plasmid) [Frondihabitans sucicola]|uniref:Uncharacterized protein n=1 Tax=Frondihabitans sucicola TaxID=1268041 RepID=A0ABN6Y9P8_9MICO|nr:hypothetical protein [Frondihabitans sucicola]BDZ52650.1 hypothetical protein GCM10025867_48910 [Frondihabitans sucicola]